MKLAEFLKLDSLEENISYKTKIKISKYLNEATAKEENIIYTQITKLKLDTILKLALTDPIFNQFCTHASLKQHWEQLWKQCGPIEPLMIEYLPIPTISCFELLKGIYVYEGYRKLIQETHEITMDIFEEAKTYLTLSADCGCFFALNALCIEGLKLLSTLVDKQLKFELFFKIIHYANKAADLYWTPGYLLLANVLQELTLNTDSLFEDDKLNKKKLFIEAMEALQIAQKLETSSHAMIHNAYQGKTIQEASHNKIISWFQIKLCLQERAGTLLTWPDINAANIRAKETVKKLLQATEQSCLNNPAYQPKI